MYIYTIFRQILHIYTIFRQILYIYTIFRQILYIYTIFRQILYLYHFQTDRVYLYHFQTDPIYLYHFQVYTVPDMKVLYKFYSFFRLTEWCFKPLLNVFQSYQGNSSHYLRLSRVSPVTGERPNLSCENLLPDPFDNVHSMY